MNPFLRQQHELFPELGAELAAKAPPSGPARPTTRLCAWDRDLDARLIASLLYEFVDRPFEVLVAAAKDLDDGQRASLLERALQDRGPRDPLPIGIEGAAPFEFECLVDFGAYRDIGRHRKGLQQQQRLTVQHGYAVPPLIELAGATDDYRAVLDRVAELQPIVAERFPLAAGYVTPFAFLQRVRLVFDPRQVAYFVELRSGPEGHFSYRAVALDMFDLVEQVSPLFARFVRVQKGEAFLGRMQAEQTADERRLQRMIRAGDVPTAEA
jgi:hypothetical protein